MAYPPKYPPYEPPAGEGVPNMAAEMRRPPSLSPVERKRRLAWFIPNRWWRDEQDGGAQSSDDEGDDKW